MLKESLTKLYRKPQPTEDPRQIARIVMARRFLNAQKGHGAELHALTAPAGGLLQAHS